MRSLTSTHQGRIIISGTGRAGTTFLVQLLTKLGFGTGFSPSEVLTGVDGISRAGLERALVDDSNPYVIKSPWFSDHLAEALQDRKIDIYAALIPIRGLFEAAESRRRVYQEVGNQGLDPLAHPGSLWRTKDPSKQEEILAGQFYATIFPLVKHDVPIYLMEFPRLVTDADYLFKVLKALLSDHGVSRLQFLDAHKAIARPALVHQFAKSA